MVKGGEVARLGHLDVPLLSNEPSPLPNHPLATVPARPIALTSQWDPMDIPELVPLVEAQLDARIVIILQGMCVSPEVVNQVRGQLIAQQNENLNTRQVLQSVVAVLQRHDHVLTKDLLAALVAAETRVSAVEKTLGEVGRTSGQVVERTAMVESMARENRHCIESLREGLQTISSAMGRVHRFVGCAENAQHYRPPTYSLEEANHKIAELSVKVEDIPAMDNKLVQCMEKIVSAQEKERGAWSSLMEEKDRQIGELQSAVQNLNRGLQDLQKNILSCPLQTNPQALGVEEWNRMEGRVQNLELHAKSVPPPWNPDRLSNLLGARV